MKHRLYEVISKQRQNLSINDEVKILVDSFYEDYDLDINIKIEEFEKEIILKETSFENLFSQELKNIKSFIDENNIKLNSVEIAGEFMRTPILQKKIEEIYEDLETNINTKKKISTTILIDECTSIGAAIFGNYIYGEFPIKQLKSFHLIHKHNQNHMQKQRLSKQPDLEKL